MRRALKVIMAAVAVVLVFTGFTYYYIGSHFGPDSLSTVSWNESRALLQANMPVEYQNVTVGGHGIEVAVQLSTPNGKIYSNSVFSEQVGVIFISNGSHAGVQFKVALDNAYANNTPLLIKGLAIVNSYIVNGSEYVISYNGMSISKNADLPAQENATVVLQVYSFYSPFLQNYETYHIGV